MSRIICVILGIVFLAAGTGKLFGYGEIPGQTIGFLDLPNWASQFIGELFFPWLLPMFEVALGIFLVVGFKRKLMAIITIPLAVVFLINNVWAISQGLDKYPDCLCFGIWEKMFGIITPFQSMFIDIGIIMLSIIVIILDRKK